MQPNPHKTVNNYNEYTGEQCPTVQPGNILISTEELHDNVQKESVHAAINLVNDKVSQILGADNNLIHDKIPYPNIILTSVNPTPTPIYGCYFADTNEIFIVTHHEGNNKNYITKVTIHEYIHFLSHNGKDINEAITTQNPISKRNNVGFRRNIGIDLRDDKQGSRINFYFSAFNEAVTEQLSIDIFPDQYEAYLEYRQLLDQVIQDAMKQKLGSTTNNGVHTPWTKEEFKNYIYRCFFKGDLESFTNFLKNVYQKYELSEYQFGLMTSKDDLPTIVEEMYIRNNPGSTPPPSKVAELVQQRLNKKQAVDYPTDVILNKKDSIEAKKHAKDYDDFITDNSIRRNELQLTTLSNGVKCATDNKGFIIYEKATATELFSYIEHELDRLVREGADKNTIIQRIDDLLFGQYRASMLSEGFKEFYIKKHLLIS